MKKAKSTKGKPKPRGAHKGRPAPLKRRSRSQRIGDEGEALFKYWAVRAGVSPNKVEHDYGIDFYCQIFRPAGPAVDEVAGGTVAAAVRTSEKNTTGQFVTLDRGDVATILKQTIPSCVAGVDLKAQSVHYRFVDIDFADELTAFLRSGNGSISFALKKWKSDGPGFVDAANQVGRPGYQHLLRVFLTEADVAAEIAGAKIEVIHGARGGAAIVDVPWLMDALEIKDADAARRLTFEKGYPSLVHGVTGIKPVLLKVTDVVGGDVYVRGRVAANYTLAVSNNGRTLGERQVVGVPFGDEVGYRDPQSGLVIAVSAARKRDGGAFHDLSVESTHGSGRMGDPGLREFLLALTEGAQLSLDGRAWVPVANFGDLLTGISATVKAIVMIAERTGVDLGQFTLYELLQEEAQRSIGCLELLLDGTATLPQIFPGCSFGPPDGEIEGKQQKADIPIAANIGGVGFVVFVTVDLLPILVNDAIQGFKLLRQHGLRVERVARLDTAGTPELWINDSWPAIPLGVAPAEGGTLAGVPPRKRPFEIVFAE